MFHVKQFPFMTFAGPHVQFPAYIRLTGRNKHLSASDSAQDIFLTRAIQLAEHVVKEKHRIFAGFPVIKRTLRKL